MSSALAAWADAMGAQTDHEAVCGWCVANRVPICSEGIRLQQEARQAHEAWVSDQYAGRAA